MFSSSAKVVNKEYILTYGYSCSLLVVPSLRSKWKRILNFIYIYNTVLGLLYTLRYMQSHLRRAWNIICKFIYTSLTYEKKTLYCYETQERSKVICISFHCRCLLKALNFDAIEMWPYKLTFKGTKTVIDFV